MLRFCLLQSVRISSGIQVRLCNPSFRYDLFMLLPLYCLKRCKNNINVGRGKKVADVAVNVVVEGIGAKKRSRPEKGKINEAKNVINGETPESITTEEQTALAPSSVDKGKSKRQQKPIKTVNEEESSKVEEKEENVRAKRGRKGKIENGDLDSVNSAEVKQKTETDGEVKELPTRSRRKEPAVVEQGNLKKENKSQAKEMKGKAHKKTAPVQLAEDMVEKEAPSRGAGRKRKNAVEKTESETAESVKSDETFVVDENRQLRVAIKRNRKLDEMAVNEKSNDTEVKNAKGPSKSKGKRVAKNSDEDSKPIKKVKEDASKSKSSSKKEKIPDVTALDFSNDSKSVGGKPWNLKIATWNVNGVRAWLEKNGMSYLHHEKPDILTIQETKCSQDKLPAEVNVDGYECYWLSGDKDGYSGIGLLSKKKPLTVEYGIGIDAHDNEGRVITAEYDEFYLVTTYVPNAGRGLVRLDYRQEWDKDFRAYLKKLDEKKPVVLCGDLNVAHEEIDLANPKTNKKNAGFTKEERDGFSALLSEGFVDTFRHFYPKESGAYTFWTYMMNARAKNVGWRLDYFVTSKRFVDHLCDSVIRKDVYGSDHCPITLFLHV